MPEDPADLALDLTQDYPRSPRALFAGYVIVGRILDKCRAFLNGTAGEYEYNYGMDRVFFEFAGIDADAWHIYEHLAVAGKLTARVYAMALGLNEQQTISLSLRWLLKSCRTRSSVTSPIFAFIPAC